MQRLPKWENRFPGNHSQWRCRSGRSQSRCRNRRRHHHLGHLRNPKHDRRHQLKLMRLQIGSLCNRLRVTSSGNPDYRDTMITASLWQDTYGQLLLSTMQGPMAANPAINMWSQYLRRIAAYGCMIFGVCSPRVVYEEDAAKIPEDDWLKLYSHINRT